MISQGFLEERAKKAVNAHHLLPEFIYIYNTQHTLLVPTKPKYILPTRQSNSETLKTYIRNRILTRGTLDIYFI